MSIEDGQEFPRPASNLALIDLDETILDTNYEVTDPGLYAAVQEAQSSGWTIGLSSDTPYEGLLLWRDRLGMNGPIIAEKGAVIATADGPPQYDAQEAAAYTTSRQAITERLGVLGIGVWSGNPVEALRQNLRFGKPGDTFVLLNDLRRCSLSFFVRLIGNDGTPQIDAVATEAVDAAVRDLYPSSEDMELDVNPDYGIVIANRTKNNKRAGSQKLLGRAGTFAMIGNSMGDYVGDDLAVHYAVSNATEEYLQKASYIASQPLTTGVVEVLQKLSTAEQS